MSATRTIVVATIIPGLIVGGAAAALSSAQVTSGEFAAMNGSSVEGQAKLVRTPDVPDDGRTRLSVDASGLTPGNTYATHLHAGSCSNTSSPHYKHDPSGPGAPPNELWASSDPRDPFAAITANNAGRASGNGVAEWTARPEAASVVIHATPTGGTRIACADLA